MKVLIAVLNWGLGHATRSAALVYRHLAKGDDVVIGGDGESLAWLKHQFPKLRAIPFAPLRLRYSKGRSQIPAMIKAAPKVLISAYWDHKLLNELLEAEHFDLVISDNRFGMYSRKTRCVYMTHQLHIELPQGWQWLSGLADRLHRDFYKHYDEVWIPDYEDINISLAGELSHPVESGESRVESRKYIGPLSRFEYTPQPSTRYLSGNYKTVAVLSGLEPQRSLFEKEIIRRFQGTSQSLLVVRGKPREPFMRVTNDNVTIVPWLNDDELRDAMTKAELIIARSGYSTIMDLQCLGLLKKAELHPTPGQSEQEYLGKYILLQTTCK